MPGRDPTRRQNQGPVRPPRQDPNEPMQKFYCCFGRAQIGSPKSEINHTADVALKGPCVSSPVRTMSGGYCTRISVVNPNGV